MPKFKLETSFQFPFFKFNELVSYTEVKKPTGLAYMILVLLSESKDKNLLIFQVLNNFNVPSSLHYIFADTILDLINQGILDTSDGEAFIKLNFSKYRIKDIVFTEKGKKIFKEEAIPTGTIKEAKIPVFYNVALNELSYRIDDLEPKPLMDSAITEEWINGFSLNKSIEDYLNLTKGTKIPIFENGKKVKDELIKKEEVITKVEDLSKENWTGKYDCQIELDNAGVTFSFDDPVLQKFFDKLYTIEMINKAISYKTKFNFDSAYANNLKLTDYLDQLDSVIIPKDLKNILNKKYELVITKGNYKSQDKNLSIVANKELTSYSSNCEFITIDRSGESFSYIPGIFAFNDSEKGIINIPLVIKEKVPQSQIQSIISSYIEHNLKDFSLDNYSMVIKLCDIADYFKIGLDVLKGYLKDSPEDNLVLLNSIKDTSLSTPEISNKFKEIVNLNYDAYFKLLGKNNLETFLKITSWIPKLLNLKEDETLKRMDQALIAGGVDTLSTYELLVKYNFNKELASLYFNPVPEALKKRNSSDKSLNDLINFDSNLKSLKNITQIKDLKDYIFDEEKVDRNIFKNAYLTAKKLQNSIQIFKKNNEDLFNEYDNFMTIFGKINDDFNMQEEALKNPNKISEKLISDKIDRGDYQFVFVNLATKLESILKTKFSLNGKLSNMLSEARKNKLIERSVATDLHNFRENRNAYVHPEDRTTNFKVEDLRRWNSEISELEKKEEE